MLRSDLATRGFWWKRRRRFSVLIRNAQMTTEHRTPNNSAVASQYTRMHAVQVY